MVEHLSRNRRTQGTLEQLAEVCGEDPALVRFATVGVEHHLAHIASAYYLSPFEDLTAGLSYDASGDFASLMAARCEGTRIQVLDRVTLPHSLGFLYTALCQFIGFDEFGEEYKVIGLAPYGEDRYGELMRELVRLDAGHWYRLATDYFGMHEGGESGAVDATQRIVMGRFYTDRLSAALGAPRRRAEPLTQREMDIARSTQVRFEEAAGRYDAWRLPSNMMFMGRWLRYSGLYPSYQVRLGHRDRFRFKQVGHGQREDLAADLFVLPTFNENFGLVVAEALSYGVPAITT